jgi:hypothetical protein
MRDGPQKLQIWVVLRVFFVLEHQGARRLSSHDSNEHGKWFHNDHNWTGSNSFGDAFMYKVQISF